MKAKSNKQRVRKKLLLSCCLLLVTCQIISFYLPLITFHLTSPVFADETTNNNYTIDVGNIDTNPQPTSKPQILKPTHKEISDFTTGTNYTVVTSSNSVTIELSQNLIDFGILSSTNPVVRTSEISLRNPPEGGQILTYENHSLMSATHDIIPDTSCDNGACSPDVAALWTNTLTYGFGYRCDSNKPDICDDQLINQNYYKQYPSDSQLPQQIIMNKQGITTSKAAITNKINISGTQKTGGYYNSISYLAIPNF